MVTLSLFTLLLTFVAVNCYLEFLFPSSKVTVSDISKINAIGNGSFSISLWFQGEYSGDYSTPQALLSTRKTMGYHAFMVAFSGNWNGYTPYRPFIQLRYNALSYSAPQVYTDGNWQHLVITRQININGSCYLNYYVNTTNIYSYGPSLDAYCNNDIYHEGGSLWIGDDVATSGWVGNLAEISIWNKSLSVQEINSIFININLNNDDVSFDNLLHYYPLNETCIDSQIIHDVWNHHDGVLSSSSDPKCVSIDIEHAWYSNTTTSHSTTNIPKHTTTEAMTTTEVKPETTTTKITSEYITTITTTTTTTLQVDNNENEGEYDDSNDNDSDTEQGLQKNSPSKNDKDDSIIIAVAVSSVVFLICIIVVSVFCWKSVKSKREIKDLRNVAVQQEGVSPTISATTTANIAAIAEGASNSPVFTATNEEPGMIGMTAVRSLSSAVASEYGLSANNQNTEDSCDDDIYEDVMPNSMPGSVVVTPKGVDGIETTTPRGFTSDINDKDRDNSCDDDMYDDIPAHITPSGINQVTEGGDI